MLRGDHACDRQREADASGGKPTKTGVSPKSRKNDSLGVGDHEKRLAESLEQRTATTEILGVISSSPTNAQPVFDAIAVNALRLCDAAGAVVVRYDGALLHVVAHHNVNPEAVERLGRQYPQAPDRHAPMSRAVLDGAGQPLQTADRRAEVLVDSSEGDERQV